MSSRQPVQLACPDCGEQEEYLLWSGVNVTLEPELKAEVLRHELNQVTCGSCGASFSVVSTVVYHDMENGLMIELRPEGPEFEERQWSSDSLREETENWAKQAVREMGYKLRRVVGMNDLVEKVLVFDAQLDDRVVEVIKRVLARSAPDALLFFVGRRDDEGAEPLLVFERHGQDRHERLTLPFEVYEEMAEKMAALPQPGPEESGNWPRVDARFAEQFLD